MGSLSSPMSVTFRTPQTNAADPTDAGSIESSSASATLAGDAGAHFFWQIPGSDQPELVPSEALIPDPYDPRSR